jgi:hypothetical protein
LNSRPHRVDLAAHDACEHWRQPSATRWAGS